MPWLTAKPCKQVLKDQPSLSRPLIFMIPIASFVLTWVHLDHRSNILAALLKVNKLNTICVYSEIYLL